MGLNTTHDCWTGGYHSFGIWRTAIAKACGIPLRLMDGFYDEPPLPKELTAGPDTNKTTALMDWAKRTDSLLPLSWDLFKDDAITPLLNHEDCEGELAVEVLLPLADRLEGLLDKLPEGDGPGHVRNWRDTTQRFITGLRLAASLGEPVEFH